MLLTPSCPTQGAPACTTLVPAMRSCRQRLSPRKIKSGSIKTGDWTYASNLRHNASRQETQHKHFPQRQNPILVHRHNASTDKALSNRLPAVVQQIAMHNSTTVFGSASLLQLPLTFAQTFTLLGGVSGTHRVFNIHQLIGQSLAVQFCALQLDGDGIGLPS